MGKDGNSSDEGSKPTVAKTPVELQRFKLEKLMKNPDKPVVIPERVKEKKMPHVPEFVRNVMGSSAGAGSGEFHVYRHLRRKEYARQKFIQEKSEKQLLEEAYHQKLLDNMQAAEERTAKKRAKRLRKKHNYKKNKVTKPKGNNSGQSQTESDSENISDSESEKEREPSIEDKVEKEQENSAVENTVESENNQEHPSESENSVSSNPEGHQNRKLTSGSSCKSTVNKCSENVEEAKRKESGNDSKVIDNNEEESMS